jgi:hypothetical protein
MKNFMYMIKLFYYNQKHEPLKVITFGSIQDWLSFNINLKPPPTSSYVKLSSDAVWRLDGLKLRLNN